jgi:2-hydroxychromene-2-carboxylate isomerase
MPRDPQPPQVGGQHLPNLRGLSIVYHRERIVHFTERLSVSSVTFYFDLGSPYAYLSAERLATVLPGPVTWQPVLLGGLFKLTGRSSWALGDYRRRQAGMAEIERRTRDYGLAPMRWPDPWPADYLLAMRATTFAFAAGRGREFTQQAFRSAFHDGRQLEVEAHVLDAGVQAGIDREELREATRDPQIKQALRDATDVAYERGVIGVPTIAVDEQLFWGDDRLEDAAAHLAGGD